MMRNTRGRMVCGREKQEQIYDDWFHKFDGMNLKYSLGRYRPEVIYASNVLELLECSYDEKVQIIELMSQKYYTMREFKVILATVLDYDREYVYWEYFCPDFIVDEDLIFNDGKDYLIELDYVRFDLDF